MYVIYLRSGRVLLSKKAYSSWHEIQEEYEDYMASLGPWSAEEVSAYLREEYPGNVPFTEFQVQSFAESSDLICE